MDKGFKMGKLCFLLEFLVMKTTEFSLKIPLTGPLLRTITVEPGFIAFIAKFLSLAPMDTDRGITYVTYAWNI